MLKPRKHKGLLDNSKNDRNYKKNNFVSVKFTMSQEEHIKCIKNQMEHYSHVTDANLLMELIDF
jgi:hypothetical protein